MKTQNDMRVTIRVDKELKKRAENLFSRLGMNMSTAMNIFLRKAVNEAAIPFRVSDAKNSGPEIGLSPAEITNAFTAGVRGEIEEKQRNGFPVARYDADRKQAYLEFSGGTREYIDG